MTTALLNVLMFFCGSYSYSTLLWLSKKRSWSGGKSPHSPELPNAVFYSLKKKHISEHNPGSNFICHHVFKQDMYDFMN